MKSTITAWSRGQNNGIPPSWHYVVFTFRPHKSDPDIFSSFPPYCQQIDRKIKPLFMMTSATSSSSLWPNLLSQGPYLEQLLWLEVWDCDSNPGLGQIISPLPCSPPRVGGVPLKQGHLKEGLHHIGQLVYYCLTKGNGLWVAQKKKGNS